MVFSEQPGIFHQAENQPDRWRKPQNLLVDLMGTFHSLPSPRISMWLAWIVWLEGPATDRGIMDPIGQVTKMLTSQKGDWKYPDCRSFFLCHQPIFFVLFWSWRLCHKSVSTKPLSWTWSHDIPWTSWTSWTSRGLPGKRGKRNVWTPWRTCKAACRWNCRPKGGIFMGSIEKNHLQSSINHPYKSYLGSADDRL